MAFNIELRNPGAVHNISLASGGAVALGSVCVSEAWKAITDAYVCVSETWKPVTEMKVCVSETWKSLV
jgi:hypothetical protein